MERYKSYTRLVSGLLLGLFAFSSETWAIPTGGKKYRFELQGGLSSQDFDGITGANFTKISRETYGTSFSYAWGSWENGLQFMITPRIAITPVIFSTNVVGSYKNKFIQYQYYTGLVYNGFRIGALVGLEKMSWVGTPDLGYSNPFRLQLGGQMSYDFWKRGMWGIYGLFRYISHSEREFEFANLPDDSFTIKAGAQMDYLAGVYVQF